MKKINNIKIGLFLIIAGNVSYLLNNYFIKNPTSAFGEFLDGFLLGFSVGANVIGIILIMLYISKEEKE